MSEKYTGQDRRYTGQAIDITYNVKRCIHAAHCTHKLAEVFDTQKRPWINPDGAEVERVASVIEMCPSGALHYDREDGVQEAIPTQNTIRLWHNGPLEVRGDLAIHGATVELAQETRVTLCRCGASKYKPFCDNTHKETGFEAVDIDPIQREGDRPTDGKLTITAHENGPLEVEGHFEIINEAGQTLFTGSKTWLCRCGSTAKKPFCDGTHKQIVFIAE